MTAEILGLPPTDETLVRQIVGQLTGTAPEPGTEISVTWIGQEQPRATATGGTWRLSGNLPRPWSVVLKRIMQSTPEIRSKNWPVSNDVSHPMYWKREALFYGQLASTLGPDFAAPPAVVHVAEDGTSCDLWLADLGRDSLPGNRWSLDEYVESSHHLGRAQGAYLVGARALPTHAWLSTNWLRWYVERREYDVDRWLGHDDIMRDPLVAALFAHGDVRRELIDLYNQRRVLLRDLDRMERVLNHHDYWPPNLFLVPHRAGRRTLAIDWAYAGIGAVAEDAANIVIDAVNDGFFPGEEMIELDMAVFEDYLAGLRESGSRIERDRVRFSYTTTACLKYFWIAIHMIQLILEHRARPDGSARIGFDDTKDLDTVVHRRAYSVARVASHFTESRALADRLGLR